MPSTSDRVLVQPLEIGLHHDLAANEARSIYAALFGHRLVSVSACRPASVIFTRAISTVRLPITTRWLCAAASPARTSSTICLIVKPWASRIASVQPSLLAASNSSARRRAGLGRLRTRDITVWLLEQNGWINP